MTDEQLERIARRAEMTLCPENRHTWDGELATGCLALIADYRRLRELERAVRAILTCVDFGTEMHWYLADDIPRAKRDAIGRLLEGKE